VSSRSSKAIDVTISMTRRNNVRVDWVDGEMFLGKWRKQQEADEKRITLVSTWRERSQLGGVGVSGGGKCRIASL
jgi:hypothetical protein